MFTLIGADGKEYGPVTADQLREWMAQNRVTLDMKVRREGTTEWQRLGDQPEFAAAAPGAAAGGLPPPSTGAFTGAPAATPAVTPPERIVFTGEWVEYFKIWIVNVLLTILTLGIYAAWAKVRKRRYFYANTRVFGHTFEYLANPVKILYGNLIVVGMFLLYTAVQAINPLLSLPFLLAFLVAFPWFICRALMFNARYTAWRGLRFNFVGRYGEAAAIFLGWPLLIAPTLGLIFPFIAKRQREFIVSRHTYGTSPFSFEGQVGEFYKIYGIAVLFFLPMIIAYFMIIVAAVAAQMSGGAAAPVFGGLMIVLFTAGIPLAIAGTFYFRARMFNFVWNNTSLAGNRFVGSMRPGELFVLHFVNSLVTLVTFGLLHPWAVVRTVKYQLDSLQVVPAGNIDAFVAAAQPPVSALGEAASDFFDFDLGFGL